MPDSPRPTDPLTDAIMRHWTATLDEAHARMPRVSGALRRGSGFGAPLAGRQT